MQNCPYRANPTPNGKQSDVVDASGNHAKMTYDGFDRLAPTGWRSGSSRRPRYPVAMTDRRLTKRSRRRAR